MARSKKRKRMRRRVKDQYPQRKNDTLILATLTPADNEVVYATFAAINWELPTNIDLTDPVFIECEKIWIELEIDREPAGDGVPGTANFMAYERSVEFWVTKEPRTQPPAFSDNSIIMHDTLHELRFWSNTIATSTKYLAPSSKLKIEIDLQDETTGNGILLAQPRIFLLLRQTVTFGIQSPALPISHLNHSMQYRLIDDVTKEEFFTEAIGNWA